MPDWITHAASRTFNVPRFRLDTQTNWPAVLQALHEVAFDGWSDLESFAWDRPDVAAATRRWRDLASSPDGLVREGLQFLRTACAKIDAGSPL